MTRGFLWDESLLRVFCLSELTYSTFRILSGEFPFPLPSSVDVAFSSSLKVVASVTDFISVVSRNPVGREDEDFRFLVFKVMVFFFFCYVPINGRFITVLCVLRCLSLRVFVFEVTVY